MSKEKLARRKKMGDDPTAMSKSNSSEAGAISPQPMPGAPQGAGNMMGNPKNITSMSGAEQPRTSFDQMNPQSFYGDPVFSPDVYARMGNVGIANSSGKNQNVVSGNGLNGRVAYNEQPQPFEDSMRMMDGMHQAQQASLSAQKAYGEKEMPPYKVGPLGMMGTPAELNVQQPNPGQYPGSIPGQSPGYLGLQGTPDVSASAGMNTKSGARNKPKGDK